MVRQEGYLRVKRGFKDLKQLYENLDLPSLRPQKEEKPKVWKNAPFNDPLLSKQWFLVSTAQEKLEDLLMERNGCDWFLMRSLRWSFEIIAPELSIFSR